MSYKDISTAEYEAWSQKHTEAQLVMADRDAVLDRVYEQIESDLMVSDVCFLCFLNQQLFFFPIFLS